MNLYDRVKIALENYPITRSSDKKLMWRVWYELGLADRHSITLENFLLAPTPESLTRARRQVQEDYPSLQATPQVQQQRKLKESSKGTFIYQGQGALL